jgi:ribonuclease P protein component
MIPFKNRFHGYGSLKYVYSNGETVRSRLISLKHSTHPKRKEQRIAVVVSKKVIKGAVYRNRIRRRVYETVRQELPHLEKGRDMVFVVFSAELLSIESSELTANIKQLLTDAGIYRD